MISATALDSSPSVNTMKLSVQLQGISLTFLVDSTSTHSFLDDSLLSRLSGVLEMPTVRVKIADGATVPCSKHFS